MMKKLPKMISVLIAIIVSTIGLEAQTGIVTGNVSDEYGALIGATVLVRGSVKGVTTDLDGNYTLELDPGIYTLLASYIGFASKEAEVTINSGETTTMDFFLVEGLTMDEVIVTGSRASNRTNTDAPVPIDVININQLASAAPQVSLNQIMHQSAPSFSSNTQTISDGTDHIDPASLRGLGPDQVLVLMNGKRRHTTSLVNVNGTFGRGNVGTDLNAIPASAIEAIEVLRDGAAAQYGSDAIAGVINLKLKDDVNKLRVSLTTGANFTSEIGPFNGETEDRDGEVVNLGLNYGLPLGNQGGFINFTGEMNYRGATSRMMEYTGQIFHGYNAVERVALANNLDINNLSDMQVIETAAMMNIFSQEEKDWMASTAFLHTINATSEFKTIVSSNGLDFDNPDDLSAMMALVSNISYLTSDQINSINNIGSGTASEMLDVFHSNLNDTATPLGKNVTEAELLARGQTRSDYNMRVGQSRLRGGKFFANMALPLGENMEFYSFGGLSYREGQSGCFYRLPFQSRTTTTIYLDGTVPKINSNINDQSFAAGIRGMIGNWNIDFSNVYGKNEFIFVMTDTHNATIGTSSPTTFNAGGHAFTQNTGNFDVSQYFDNISGIKGINVAFGAEYRFENFEVLPGTEQSYGNYDINGNLVTPTTPDSLKTTDFFSRSRPSGAQCFAGFLPTNQIDANRSSVAGYIDTEFDLTDEFLLGAALRFENYSDFGSTFNYKVAARYKVHPNLNVRAATSTGFRAPSLHQIHFSRTSTIFTLDAAGNSVPQEVGVFANTSRAAKLLGIPELSEETSQSFSVGFTAKVPNVGLRLTVDAYQVNIDDRVVLTGQFGPENEEMERILEQAGATRAAFFANAIDTKSQGLDVVVSHSVNFGTQGDLLRNDLAATFSQTTREGDIKASDVLERAGLVGTYFDQTSRIYLEQAVPRIKVTLGHSLTFGDLNVYLRNTYFGETTEATNAAIFDDDLELIDNSIDPYNSGKIITDLSVGYDFTQDLNVTIGANNLLDVYPDEADSSFQSSGRFVYSRRSPQFSYSGRHLFARLLFTLK